MTSKTNNREGFSLIEMIIAIAIVGIVMSAVILLISYSTNNMRRTSNTVNLQNETKDAMIHITTYLQEASDAYWDDANKALYVAKNKKNSDGSIKEMEISCYWRAKKSDVEGHNDKLPLVFANDVVDFKCLVKSNQYSYTESEGSTVLENAETVTLDSTLVDPDYVICFCKKTFTAPDEYLTDGQIDFEHKVLAKFQLNSVTFNNSDETIEGESGSTTSNPPSTDPGTNPAGDPGTNPAGDPGTNPAGDPGTNPAGDPGTNPSGDPSAAPSAETLEDPDDPVVQADVLSVGRKSVVVKMLLKNQNGDASFTSEKEVYLRNQ